MTVVVILAAGFSARAGTEARLHQRIDELVEAAPIGPRAEIVDDATFVRRAYLDLTGRVPLSVETRAFLADEAPDKRSRLVNELLASPAFERRLAGVLDVMLMERRGGKHVGSKDLRTWLRKSIEQNRSYREIARDLLAADGAAGDQRAAAAFLLERDVEPNLLTREIGRVFYGMDLQCAQCHDHPVIDDYAQTDYYGLYAFVRRSSSFRPDPKKPALIGENATGGADFKSVFTDRESNTSPRLPGSAEFAEPNFPVGDEYEVKPEKNRRAVPKYSRRAKLAELVATGGNKHFDRNIATRLWGAMMGRGLVHPVDHHHGDNPASNPELLDLLATEFAGSNYDVRSLLREIALSKTYQRSTEAPTDLAARVDAARQSIAALQARQKVADEELTAKSGAADKALEQLDAALAEAKPLRAAFTKVVSTATAAAKVRDDAEKALKGKQQALASQTPIADSVRVAFETSQAAATLLKDDKEFAGAVATLKKKSEALATTVTNLKTEVDKLIKPAADAQAKLEEARKPVDPERAKVAPIEEKIRQLRAALVAVREQVRSSRSKSSHGSRQLEFAQGIVALSEVEQAIARLEADVPVVENEIKTAEAATVEPKKNMDAAAQGVAKVRAAYEITTKPLAEAESMLGAAQKTATLISASLKQASEASTTLPKDADLAQAIASLTSSNGRMTGQVAAAEKLVAERRKVVEGAKSTLDDADARHRQAKQRFADAEQKVAEKVKRLASVKSELAQAGIRRNESYEKVVTEASNRFDIAVLEPLSPEQLGWSMLHASGHFDRIRAAERARLDKEKPLKPEELKDAAKVAARSREAEEAAYAKLTGTVDKFVKLYASQKGQPQDAFFATVDQALFLANAGDMGTWLAPAGENLTARLLKLEDPKELVRELYLSMFTRWPTDEEVASVSEYLTKRKDDRKGAIGELAWALLTSAEFRFQR